MSGRVARKFAKRWPLAVHELPFEMAPIGIFQVWHERHDRDAGHLWLRQAVKAACARMAEN